MVRGASYPCYNLNLTFFSGTCPPDVGLATSSYFIDFTKVTSLPSDWSVAAYETVEFGPNGAELTFAKRYDAPLIHTNFNFLLDALTTSSRLHQE